MVVSIDVGSVSLGYWIILNYINLFIGCDLKVIHSRFLTPSTTSTNHIGRVVNNKPQTLPKKLLGSIVTVLIASSSSLTLSAAGVAGVPGVAGLARSTLSGLSVRFATVLGDLGRVSA